MLSEAEKRKVQAIIAEGCPVQATQDPQSISNTLAPFMALANTTNVTRCDSYPYKLVKEGLPCMRP